MRIVAFRSVSAATLAVALAAFPGTGRAETRPSPPTAPASAISVNLVCDYESLGCQALASGGTGGYTFTWTNAEPGITDGNSGEGWAHCWSGHSKFTVSVTVTDSLGATGTASKYFVCP